MGNEITLQTDPIDILMAEHEEGLKQLTELEDAALKIKKNGITKEELDRVTSAINFIDNEIRFHNEKEEKHLFPLVAKYVSGPTTVMENEHRILWDAFIKLKIIAKEIENLESENSKEMLVRTSLFIVELLSSHIYKENNILFPMAQNVLSKEEYEICRVGIAKATLKIE